MAELFMDKLFALMALWADIWTPLCGSQLVVGAERSRPSSDPASLCDFLMWDKTVVKDSRVASQYQQVHSE